MSFSKFFSRISRALGLAPPVNLEALASLNPARFYVENVRSLLDVTTPEARQICAVAVEQGLFERHVAVTCPDGSQPVDARSEAELPTEVRCFVDEDGAREEVVIPTASLRTVEFYRLVNRAS